MTPPGGNRAFSAVARGFEAAAAATFSRSLCLVRSISPISNDGKPVSLGRLAAHCTRAAAGLSRAVAARRWARAGPKLRQRQGFAHVMRGATPRPCPPTTNAGMSIVDFYSYVLLCNACLAQTESTDTLKYMPQVAEEGTVQTKSNQL
jgi:hypothetical protein